MSAAGLGKVGAPGYRDAEDGQQDDDGGQYEQGGVSVMRAALGDLAKEDGCNGHDGCFEVRRCRVARVKTCSRGASHTSVWAQDTTKTESGWRSGGASLPWW